MRSGRMVDSCVNWAFEDACSSLIARVKCTRPDCDKRSALMPLYAFILFPIASPAWPRLSCFVCLLPLSFRRHFCFFLSPLSPSFNPIFRSPWHFHRLSLQPSLLDFCPRLFSAGVIWGIYQQTWSRAPLHSAPLCVETLIRGIAWQRSPPKPSSSKSTDVPSHTYEHSHEPLQVYRSFMDARLQSANLLQNFSSAEHHSYLERLKLCFTCSPTAHTGVYFTSGECIASMVAIPDSRLL